MVALYILPKVVHVLAAGLFIGVTAINGFAKVRADRRGDLRALVTVLDGMNANNLVFLAPSAAALGVSGLALAHLQGRAFSDGFVVQALGIFLVLALGVVAAIRMESRLHRLAVAACDGREPLPAEYRRLSRIWFATGSACSILILLMIVLMVLRTPMWGNT